MFTNIWHTYVTLIFSNDNFLMSSWLISLLDDKQFLLYNAEKKTDDI